MRYADPALCPDCRAPLPTGASRCPACDLVVRHPVAVELFGTLQAADSLLARLRAVSAAAPLATPAGAASLGTTPALPSYPAVAVGAPGRRGVRSASVPRILLSLGALCLLVAAVVFLAVSWSVLGVGGRTVVLATLTLSGAGITTLLQRSGLRVAAESLSVVTLGLLCLDVLGAGSAGWFGESAGSEVALTAGLVLVLGGAALAVARPGGQERLVAPGVISAIGLFLAWAAATETTNHVLLAGHALTLLGLAVAVLAHRTGVPALSLPHAVATTGMWAAGGLIALGDALDEPTLRQLWADGAGWSLLLTAAVLLVPGVVLANRPALLAGASGAATVLTAILALPVLDAGARPLGLLALGVTAAWVSALAALPRGVRAVAIGPSAAGGLGIGVLALATVAVAADRWTRTGVAFDRSFDVHLHGRAPETEPLLLVPWLLVLVALAAQLVHERRGAAHRTWAPVAGLVGGLGVAVTLASYDVLLALPVGITSLVAVTATVLALRSTGHRAAVAGSAAVLVAAAACIAALPSSALTLATAVVAVLIATGLAVLTDRRGSGLVAGVATTPALALAVVAAVDVSGAGTAWLAIPVLLAVGVLAVCLPRLEVEVGAAVVALAVLPASLAATGDPGGLTALWLTVAGCAVNATALVHASRRRVAWLGGALLLLATWVRLADLGVHTPEAYALPLAAVLVGLGLWRLGTDDRSGTSEALLPGLGAGLVPSLAWVLDDPVSLRALLLGAACVALMLLGARLRWSAPLLAGSAVGTVLVLRELAAFPGEIPTWVWIGLAGTLLVVVGTTWERRLVEVRQAVGYLGRLR
ncbi:MAG TPA: hypothetical protein VNS81_08690 [Nocardioides sp.]|nr:hypothetical protein [Nocardioides sp.]